MNKNKIIFEKELTVGELIKALQQVPQDAVVKTVGETQTWLVKEIELGDNGKVVYLGE